MNRIVLIISLWLLSSEVCFGQVTRKVLFLGNSYTYFNNMPQLVATMADGAGDSLIFDSYAPGGYTLDDHGTDAVSNAKIMAGGWDYLVLQEQSQLPAMPGYFCNYLSNLCLALRTYSPCGTVMFYMTWGRKNGDALNCPVWPPVCTYMGMDSLLRERYIEMATFEGGELSAVGAAWRYVRQHYPNIELYDVDGSHPSTAGSYLAACCFYAAIFKKDPTIINYNYVLASGTANILKQVAKQVVHDSLSFWDHAPTTPDADIIYYMGAGTNEVNFVNYSSGFTDHYFWDFGDGNTSTQKHPTRNYLNNGTYTVSMVAYNCDLDTTYTDTTYSTVTLCPFTPVIDPPTLHVCPGVTDTLWTQTYDAYQWYLDGTAIPGATNNYVECTGSNAYHVIATDNGCAEISQITNVYTYSNMVIWNIVSHGNLVGEDTACMGDSVALVLSFNKPPYPDDQYMDWEVDGQPIAGYHNDTLLITSSGVYKATVRHAVCPSLDNPKEVNFTFVPCATQVGSNSGQAPLISLLPYANDGRIGIKCEAFAKLRVYDALGRVVASLDLDQGEHRLDLQDQPSGVYFLHAISSDRRQGLSIIKQ